ncbi:methionine ABC transporter substrate-binding protein [Bacillus sp. FJAT-49705]|uniref:Lipoprotein n=1 Tax=Cytobacillus citreus TaxID=2833586 RepID=A0ABS5NS68_9BACI|nr:MetQ/NlpA family ABC transporter substrate-binding protein [Cytobacillus citreus]MBS4190661.1 methionine ABC transporter substrate-binding protein [Cytobacillus citreus]
MKKKWLSFVLTLAVALILAACGAKDENNGGSASDAGKDEKTENVTTLKVGASNVPHAEILEEAKPLLKEKGIDLEIIPFQDYVLPNKALESKELDANFFQHIPYFELQIKENGYDFVNAGSVHIEPMGVYSKKYKSLSDLPDGAHIIISNSVADHGRILAILESEGLIKLKEGVDKSAATLEDIVENPKNIKFDTDYEPSLLPQIYNNNEGDAVVINSNFAIDAGLNPLKDSIAIEGNESPYVNIIAVRKGDENSEAIKALIEVLHSDDIKNFILDKYKGAVVPAF